jgi:hypothetical protein
MDEAIEAALAEGRIVAGESDHSFGFTFGAIHIFMASGGWRGVRGWRIDLL